MMSHNRFVFGTAFAVLTLAALGLNALRNNLVDWRKWMWMPFALLSLLACYCAYRALNLPEPVASQLEQMVRDGKSSGWLRNVESVYQVQDWFIARYSAGVVLCALCLAGWLALRKAGNQSTPGASGQPVRFFAAASVLMLLELLWFGFGRNVQSDPKLYYPTVPALAQLAAAKPIRVTGVECLPANLAAVCGLEDVRGYDGADPLEYSQLLVLAADSFRPIFYAITQWQSPKHVLQSDHVRVSPVLDLLGVTHVIFRGTPPTGVSPAFQSPDYWVMCNPNALPRVFVPERVEVEPDTRARLTRLGSPDFDPRSTCYVEQPIPELTGLAKGQAELDSRSSTRVSLSLRMDTPGMVVLTDRWDKGWRATLNGRPVKIHRVNHALRGVAVPAGTGTLEFLYRPSSRLWGIALAAVALLVIVGWTAIQIVHRPREPRQQQC
jgi:hypothetical protein